MTSITGWFSSSQQGAVGNTDYPVYRNKSGFTGLPSGYRYPGGNFGLNGYAAYWWTSTTNGASDAWCRGLYYSLNYMSLDSYSKNAGASVRCLKD